MATQFATPAASIAQGGASFGAKATAPAAPLSAAFTAPANASLQAPALNQAAAGTINTTVAAPAAAQAQGFWNGVADKGKSAGSWVAKTGRDTGGWMMANKGKSALIIGGVVAGTALISNMSARDKAIDQQLSSERYGGPAR